MPWLIGCITVPLLAGLLSFVAGRRGAAIVGVLAAPVVAIMAAMTVWQTGVLGAKRYLVGGWGAPLGIELYVDGLSALMIAMTGAVGLFVSVYAWGYFAPDPQAGHLQTSATQTHKRRYFWPLWMFMWAGLFALFLSADIFNLYVTIEIVGLSAVSLVAVAGEEAASAAMRYLLVTLVGSMLYLLGVGVLYSTFGTIDLGLLAERVQAGPAAWSALGLMTAGMVLKTALFPAHFWLPPAHSAAPTPVSALLSSLVVTSTFYLLVRLWLQPFAGVVDLKIAHVLSVLGVIAIVWGSVQALLQTKLKLLVAYSTVAQLGYLFIMFPPVMHGAEAAWRGGILYAVSHACAKAAMFLAAGTFAWAIGEDTVASLCGTGARLFWTFASFSLAGLTLMGLPPSGGFVGKWLIARAAIETDQWLIVVVVFLGGLLAAGYVFKVVQMAFVPGEETDLTEVRIPPVSMQLAPFCLALVAILLGLLAHQPLALLEIGDPFQSLVEPGAIP